MTSTSGKRIDRLRHTPSARFLAPMIVIMSLLTPGMAAQAAQRPVVVELFTSQGCSSCPPADALLAQLAQRADVIALGFHVDYWDDLGWKDPLSAPGSTQRQRDYARLFNLPTIYTPQLVIEGRREMVGSDRRAVLGGIEQAAPEVTAGISFADDRHAVSIAAGVGSGRVLLVRFVRQKETSVARGENAGLAARDANGVTALTELGRWQGESLSFSIEPPKDNEGVAVLVQGDDGHILGAGAMM